MIEQLPKYPFAYGATDPRVLTGELAVTIQSQITAAAKLSKHFGASARIETINPGDSVYFALVTPKARVNAITIDGKYVDGTFDIFRGGTFTGGTPIDIYNSNDENPIASQSVFIGGITPVTLGVKSSPTAYLIGELGQGNKVNLAHADALGNKILAPDTVYIGRITNTHATEVMGPISLMFSFIEGNGYG